MWVQNTELQNAQCNKTTKKIAQFQNEQMSKKKNARRVKTLNAKKAKNVQILV